VRFLRDRRKVNVTGSALGTLVVVLAVLVVMKPVTRPPIAASPALAAGEPSPPGAAKVSLAAAADAEKGAGPKPMPPGTVNLAVAPWGEVFVNGKSRGLTPPMKNLKLPPGKYKIEIRNTKFAPRIDTVQVKSHETVTIRHEFKK
jgi:eukaryotic-like serine/threonine-protein kinase